MEVQLRVFDHFYTNLAENEITVLFNFGKMAPIDTSRAIAELLRTALGEIQPV
jgi:hypothetical protein